VPIQVRRLSARAASAEWAPRDVDSTHGVGIAFVGLVDSDRGSETGIASAPPARAWTGGPEALTDREKRLLLSEASLLAELHARVWILEEREATGR